MSGVQSKMYIFKPTNHLPCTLYIVQPSNFKKRTKDSKYYPRCFEDFHRLHFRRAKARN